MGLFIIFALITALSYFIWLYLCCEKYIIRSDFVEFISMFFSWLGSAICIFLIIFTICETCTINHTIDQLNYEHNVIQSLVDNVDPTNSTDENTLYLRALDFNKDLRNKQYWGQNIFTICLYSPRYTEVPFVKFPYEAS